MKNMLKKISFIFILLILSIVSISLADNTVNYDNEVVPISIDGDVPVDIGLSQDEASTSQKNYFYFGTDDVNLTTPITGDVFIATSGAVTIDTTINGNAFVCATSVTISENAVIQSSLFNASNSLTMAGTIGINIYDVSSDFTLNGTIKNDLFLTSSKSNINGSVYGDVNISAENISVSDSASIKNNFNYSAKEKINLSENVVDGTVNYNAISTSKEDTSSDVTDFIVSTISFVIFAVVIFILCKWFNCRFINFHTNFFGNLPKCLLYGFLGLIVTPIVCVILLILNLTLNLSFMLLAIYILTLFIASSIVIIVLSKLIAEKLQNKFTKTNNTLLTILSIVVFSIVYKLLQLIPTLGAIITFAMVMVGIGILFKNLIPAKEPKNV